MCYSFIDISKTYRAHIKPYNGLYMYNYNAAGPVMFVECLFLAEEVPGSISARFDVGFNIEYLFL